MLLVYLQPGPTSPKDAALLRSHMRRNSDSSVMDMMTDEHRAGALKMASAARAQDNPADRTLLPVDQSFSQDGVLPSHRDAESVFANARSFPGSPDMSVNWRESLGGMKNVNHEEVTSQKYTSDTPISKLPQRLSPRATTPTRSTAKSSRPSEQESRTRSNAKNSSVLNMTGERATVVISRLTAHNAPAQSELLPPPPPADTKDLSHVGMANYAPPTPIGRHSRSPKRPSVAQQILGANRSAGRSGGRNRSESVPPSNRISLHRSEAHLHVNSSAAQPRQQIGASLSSAPSSHYHKQNSIGYSQKGHSDVLTNHQSADSLPVNHVRFNHHTRTKSYSGGPDKGSTPSPTTHDLVVGMSPDTADAGRRPAPRAARRTAPSPTRTQTDDDDVKKALNFDGADTNHEEDMQVSYV